MRRLLAAQMPDLADRPLTMVEPWGTDNGSGGWATTTSSGCPASPGRQDQPGRKPSGCPGSAAASRSPCPNRSPSAHPGSATRTRGPSSGGSPAGRRARHHRRPGHVRPRPRRGRAQPPARAGRGAPEPHNRARPLQGTTARPAPPSSGPATLSTPAPRFASGRTRWPRRPRRSRPLGPRRPRGQLPRPRRAPLRIRRLGLGLPGDPAVDVQVVWSPLFTDESRRTFLDELEVDDATVRRQRGAAINQACAALPYYLHTYPLIVERSWHKLAAARRPRREPVLTRGRGPVGRQRDRSVALCRGPHHGPSPASVGVHP